MATVPTDVHNQLLERRARVEAVAKERGYAPQLESLLLEIDRAIDRFTVGTFGRCETCGDPIEADRLQVEPLTRFCLDHLSSAQARALEQDLELASRVQRNLLPAPETTVQGWQADYHYEPLGAVSGDFVDLVRPSLDPGILYFLLGDIAGKGVAASMLMAHLHASVRTLIDLGLPLPQVLERANRVFCESTMANHYATLVCGRLSSDGELELCNAGHCQPLLIHDGRHTLLDPTTVPLGLFCVQEYPSIRTRMAHGDSLLLYTDGATETFDENGREYGVERLSQVALAHAAGSPHSLIGACVKDVAAFRGRAPRTDDMTLMVIRRV